MPGYYSGLPKSALTARGKVCLHCHCARAPHPPVINLCFLSRLYLIQALFLAVFIFHFPDPGGKGGMQGYVDNGYFDDMWSVAYPKVHVGGWNGGGRGTRGGQSRARAIPKSAFFRPTLPFSRRLADVNMTRIPV